jgi:hypothetical protein
MAHAIGSKTGQHKKANASYRHLVAVIREIRERGPEAQEAFLTLLDHSHIGVRVWAATHALWFDPGTAQRVLQEIASGPSSLDELTARMVLQQWRSGAMRFPEEV